MDNFLLFRSRKVQIWYVLFASFGLYTLLSCTSKEDSHHSLIFNQNSTQWQASTQNYDLVFAEKKIVLRTAQGSQSALFKLQGKTTFPEMKSGGQLIYENAFGESDLIFYNKESGNIGYDLIVPPSANVEAIKWKVGQSAYLNTLGELIIPTEEGKIKYSQPISYQVIKDELVKINSQFALADGMLSFDVGHYDPNYELIIDPEISFLPMNMMTPVHVGTESSSCNGCNSLNVNVPTANNEDFLLAVVATDGNESINTPSGWTLLNSGQSQDNASTLYTFFRFVDGSEPASYTFNGWSNEHAIASITAYSGVDTNSPFDASVQVSTGSSNAPVAPDITTSTDNVLVVRIVSSDNNRAPMGIPSGHTGRLNAETSGSNEVSLVIADEEQATAGSAGTATFTFPSGNGAEQFRALSIALAPPPCALDITSIFSDNCSGDDDNGYTADWNISIEVSGAPADGMISYQRNDEAVQMQTLNGTTADLNITGVPADGGKSDTIKVWFTNEMTCGDTSIITRPAPCPPDVAACVDGGSGIGGNVFDDFNYSGTDDGDIEPGIQGVKVYIYDCDGNRIDSTFTDADGDYAFTDTGNGGVVNIGESYRIEFDLPESVACWATPTLAGGDNGTTIQFANAGDCASLGLADPADFCEEDPTISISCFGNGDPNVDGGSAGTLEAIVSFPYQGTVLTTPAPTKDLLTSDIGSVWGAAFEKTTRKMFAASFLKRHTGLKDNNLGAIYAIDYSGGAGNTTLETVIDVPNVGTFPNRGLTGDALATQLDRDVFNLTCKIGLGDLDISADGNTIWTVNLNTRELLAIDVTAFNKNPNDLPTAADITAYPIPNPRCSNGDYAPFGLGIYQGQVYVGVTCTAETSQDRNDLSATVYTFNGSSFNQVASFPLTYKRGILRNDNPANGLQLCDEWQPWTRDTTDFLNFGFFNFTNDNFPCYGSPLLSDIDFTDNGNMVVAIMDRTGHQQGRDQLAPIEIQTNPNPLFSLVAGGETLKLEATTPTSFLLENNATVAGVTTGGANNGQGPGGGEFFYQDDFVRADGLDQHQDTGFGALARLRGQGEVIITRGDPLRNQNDFNAGGISWMSSTTGEINRANNYRIYSSQDNALFGKSNGLGDLEFLCEAAPIEIGNYVWEDLDRDGLQDGCEPGIEGLIVQLYDRNGNLVAQDTTDENGQYYFNPSNVDTTGINVDGAGMSTPNNGMFTGISPETDYFVVFGDGQTTDGQPTLEGQIYDFTVTDATDPNSDLDDEIDSDANGNDLTSDADEPAGIPDGLGFIPVTSPPAGNVNHSLDVGLAPELLGSIGNYVWVDEDSDGFQDEGERGIPNVRVILRDQDGNQLDVTYTDANGNYLFNDLPSGDYFVDIDETSLPNGLTQTSIFTNNVDGDDADNVADDGDLGNQDHSGNGYAITLDAGEENLTADFGYNFNPTNDVNDPTGSPTATLGDRIWVDSDGDGVQDPNEVGVSGVEVTLTGAGPDGIFGTPDDLILTTTTDENGYYIFNNLPPGAYVTEVTDDTGASHPILGGDFNQTGDPDDFGGLAMMPDNRQTTPVVLGPGDVYLNADYGYQPGAGAAVGSIGNTIWLDADADGNGPDDGDPLGDGDNGTGVGNDNNENPIEGVSVTLIADENGNGVWDDGEPIIATDVTDENGNYLFEGLPLDDGDGDADYIIWVNDIDNVLDGLEATFDEDGGAGMDATGVGDDASAVGGMSAVALSAGTPDDRDQDFGYTPEGNEPGDGFIGNYVWFDGDGNDNGPSDADADGDSGIEGVVLELLNANGQVIATTTTDENGFYLFGGLDVDADGELYKVQIASSNFDMGGVLEGLESSFEPDGDNDNEGDFVTLTTANPGNLDQDFGFTGDDDNTLGSIGDLIWNDKDADGIFEPNGRDGIAGTPDDELPFAGVTLDLYRDLNGDGIINPGEPKIGTQITDANGNYLFDNLPLGDYIVDVTDTNGVLAGYSQSLSDNQLSDTGSGNDAMDNAKTDAFAVTIDAAIPDNRNVDFGYYKDGAAVGNYVWFDSNKDGLQNDGETGINGVVVQLDIEYPDGTMITVFDTTRNDANGNPGFYNFENLLLDEDYAMGAGMNGDDPNGVDPSGTNTPKFVISVDPDQDAIEDRDGIPTIADVNSNGNDLTDSDDFDGVLAIPIVGSTDTSAQDPATDENPIASYDFGIIEEELGSIGNYIWLDEDSDGLQDEGERGIPNVRVFLKDGDGNIIASTYTDADGKYLFTDLPAGDYFVDVDEINLPIDVIQTNIFTNNVDGDDADNVADDGDLGNKDHSGDGYAITLDPGEENLTADFGYNYNSTDNVNGNTGLAALGDRVWIDSDGDGVQDPNEVGVGGIEITLTGAGPDGIFGNGDDVTQTTTTDDNGYYIFTDLVPGAYVTEVTDDTDATHEILGADYEQTGDPDHFGVSEADNDDDNVENDNQVTNPIVLGPGDVYLNADYGYQPQANAPLGSIGNTIWLDADADGNGPADNDLMGGDGDNGVGAEDDNNEEPIAGVSVALIVDNNGNGVYDVGDLIVATDVTDENGNYLFEALPIADLDGDPVNYLVWVNDTDNVLDGLESTFDEDNQAADVPDATGLMDDAALVGGMSAITLSAAMPDNRDQDFGFTPIGHDPDDGFIGNYVWFDTDGNDSGQVDAEADMDSGIEGVLIELLDANGNVIRTTTTDENGFYLFGGLDVDADGEMYQVRIASSNFMMGGVLEGLESSFEPDGDNDNEGDLVTLTTAMPGNLDQDFGFTGDDDNTLGSVGNLVWNDKDADGVYEPNGRDGIPGTPDDELPFEGVTLDLYRDLNGDGIINPGEPKIGTQTTDTNGNYLFDNLPLGDYIVDVTDENDVLAGYWQSISPNQSPTSSGGDDAMDNSKVDAFAVTINTAIPDNRNVDFGYYKDGAAVGNYVWNDLNANGLQDDGEPGINGVEVTMMIEYPDGTIVTLVTTTRTENGKMGFYEFPNLLLDEDYAMGAGNAEDDPSGVNATATMPKFTISINTVGQDGAGQPLDGLAPTAADVSGGGQQPSDSESISGVNATPVQGSENTTPNADETLEADEAQYDFGFTDALVGIGGTVWEDQGIGGGTQNDGTQDGGEPGIGGVLIELLNDMGMVVATTRTNVDGTYLFEGLQPGDYRVRIPVSNFGGPLSGLPFSSVPTNRIDNDDTDNNDDGRQFFANGETISSVFTLTVGGEPSGTDEIRTPQQDGTDGSTRDVNTNTTIDFGFQDQVLPVELLYFDAKADQDHIDLTWATASEIDNNHFDLERSEDAKSFKAIARIEGQGTTLQTSEYTYADKEVQSGITYYYRLKQVDLDGTTEYSDVVTAQLSEDGKEWTLYPNPVGEQQQLQVELYSETERIDLYVMDALGKRVLQVTQEVTNKGWQQVNIDVSSLPAGTYLLLDTKGNQQTFVKTK
ncbi:MAG: SdrD B-like domain-containing protein [Bacteroidota bacterium]